MGSKEPVALGPPESCGFEGGVEGVRCQCWGHRGAKRQDCDEDSDPWFSCKDLLVWNHECRVQAGEPSLSGLWGLEGEGAPTRGALGNGDGTLRERDWVWPRVGVQADAHFSSLGLASLWHWSQGSAFLGQVKGEHVDCCGIRQEAGTAPVGAKGPSLTHYSYTHIHT